MKRQRKKYLRPSHPWEKARMDAEDAMLAKFGLRRKEEIWRAQTLLRNFRSQARNLLAASGPQAEKETKQLISRLYRLGLVSENATLDDVLGLTVDKLLERRLQTIVQRKGLAQTMWQARQLITHGHIAIAGRCVNVPSYLVPLEEEPLVGYLPNSPLAGAKPKDVETTETKPSEEKNEAALEAAVSDEQVREG
jgi:small subunit ribosomal protein S4